MNKTPWYRVPEVWLLIALLVGGVSGATALAAVAMSLPDAYIANADTQTHAHPLAH
jgi:hypothetical protein